MRALTCAGYEYMKLMVAELQRQLGEIERSKGETSFCYEYIQHFISFVHFLFFVCCAILQIKQITRLNLYLNHHLGDKIHVKILSIDQPRHHLFMLLQQKVPKVHIENVF